MVDRDVISKHTLLLEAKDYSVSNVALNPKRCGLFGCYGCGEGGVKIALWHLTDCGAHNFHSTATISISYESCDV